MLAGDDSAAGELTAVVCDDDRVTRGVISDLITERGGRVLAETDQAADAIDLIERYRPTLVVCDMSLETGSGMDIVEYLAGSDIQCQVVVFTAFTDMLRRIEGFAVRVVSKPDFERLQTALDAAIEDTSAVVADRERRRLVRALTKPTMRQDNGLDDPADFYRELGDAIHGDALLAVRVAEEEVEEVATALRQAVRAQDLLVRRHEQLIVLLVGGGSAAPPAVLRRLAATHPAISETATIVELDPDVRSPTEAFMDLQG